MELLLVLGLHDPREASEMKTAVSSDDQRDELSESAETDHERPKEGLLLGRQIAAGVFGRHREKAEEKEGEEEGEGGRYGQGELERVLSPAFTSTSRAQQKHLVSVFLVISAGEV